MKHIALPVIMAVIISAAAVGFGAQGGWSFPPIPELKDRVQFFRDNPRLLEASSWKQEIDLTAMQPKINALGAASVGNGYAFALMGNFFPQNTLFNVMGPYYEREEGFFPRAYLELVNSSGEAVKLPYQRLWKVSGTGIVVTEETDGAAALFTVTYAPKGIAGILRHVIVANLGADTLEGFGLRLAVDKLGPDADGVFSSNIGDKFLKLRFSGARIKADKNGVVVDLPPIQPGGQFLTDVALGAGVSFPDAEAAAKKLEPEKGPLSLLPIEIADWDQWMLGTLKIEASDPRLNDLVTDHLVLIRQQQSALGGFSAAAYYGRSWMRDPCGPILLYLWNGKFDDIKRHLVFVKQAVIQNGGFRNSYDLNTRSLPDPDVKVDWDKLGAISGDDPNLLVLQHYWYWRHTGDNSLIAAQYPMLLRALRGQNVEGYKFPFHSDETYQVFFAMSARAQLAQAFSADTGFEYAAANDAMARMALALKRKNDAEGFIKEAETTRTAMDLNYWNQDKGCWFPALIRATGKPFASPFAEINLRPLWIDYLPPSDPRIKSNLKYTLETLLNPDFTMRSSKQTGMYTGMIPGFLLVNLAKEDDPRAEDVFWAILNLVASPLGEFAEGYDIGNDFLFLDEPRTVRPWEGGINVDAVLFYLTGLQYDNPAAELRLKPILPRGMDHIAARHISLGPKNKLDILVQDLPEGRKVTVNNRGPKLPDVKVLIPVPFEIASVEFGGKSLLGQPDLGTRMEDGRFMTGILCALENDKPLEILVRKKQ